MSKWVNQQWGKMGYRDSASPGDIRRTAAYIAGFRAATRVGLAAAADDAAPRPATLMGVSPPEDLSRLQPPVNTASSGDAGRNMLSAAELADQAESGAAAFRYARAVNDSVMQRPAADTASSGATGPNVRTAAYHVADSFLAPSRAELAEAAESNPLVGVSPPEGAGPGGAHTLQLPDMVPLRVTASIRSAPGGGGNDSGRQPTRHTGAHPEGSPAAASETAADPLSQRPRVDASDLVRVRRQVIPQGTRCIWTTPPSLARLAGTILTRRARTVRPAYRNTGRELHRVCRCCGLVVTRRFSGLALFLLLLDPRAISCLLAIKVVVIVISITLGCLT